MAQDNSGPSPKPSNLASGFLTGGSFFFFKMSICDDRIGKISSEMHFNIRISFTCQIFIDFAKAE